MARYCLQCDHTYESVQAYQHSRCNREHASQVYGIVQCECGEWIILDEFTNECRRCDRTINNQSLTPTT